jgi:hypothetical protein
MSKKSFIPQNKPKSWVFGVFSVLSAVLFAGPLSIAGIHYSLPKVEFVGRAMFWLSWAIGVVSWLIFMAKLVGGKYRGIQEKSWKEQIW